VNNRLLIASGEVGSWARTSVGLGLVRVQLLGEPTSTSSIFILPIIRNPYRQTVRFHFWEAEADLRTNANKSISIFSDFSGDLVAA
jgi:hypothetical protein